MRSAPFFVFLGRASSSLSSFSFTRRHLATNASANAMPPRQRAKATTTTTKQPAGKKAKEEEEAAPAPQQRKRQKRDAAAPATAPPPPTTTTTTNDHPRRDDNKRAYWLVKSEPDEYSVDDLAAGKGGGQWDGVRNFSARNNLRAMRQGDLCLFYHSSCAVPGVVAIARVTSKQAYPDPTALDKKSDYYDQKHTLEAPRWFCVDLALERRLRRQVTLQAIKKRAAEVRGSVLGQMALLTKPRLSVQPVTALEWEEVLGMEEEGEDDETR